MKYVFIIVLMTCNGIVWAQNALPELPEPKRFIDKIEVFAGPSLSFNYGNKFIENYKNGNIENKRFLKFGYTAGVGVYHSFSRKIQLNARLQYEQKGRKTELNTPLTSTSRAIIFKDYSYNYFTLVVAPQFMLGSKQQWLISLGAYYGKIKGMTRYERLENTLDNTTSEGDAEGRSFEDVDANGGVYTGTWFPGLRSFEMSDMGAIASIGYVININEKQRVIIQIIDNLGLKNINRDKPFNQEEKNHSINLLVSYTFQRPLKK